MAASSYAITGIPTTRAPDGALPLRQEIDTWSANPANVDQVNLYLQALATFQKMPATDKLSYFQIAGEAFCQYPPCLCDLYAKNSAVTI
ncbi:hypothetical protein TWF730_007524 [Orbilia blumenaviensis]|uniref:Uncharacterized protein n=1 Tax=Orbilia blumenaviensis TaxID=1796055 RepID=A0AAV9V808_9PEZI